MNHLHHYSIRIIKKYHFKIFFESLVKTICYPESTRFYSKACDYILTCEADALHMHKDSMQATHDFFELKKCGLVLDSENPFIGASPDGIISCSCCGEGVVEVKCPFSCRDKSFDEAVKDREFWTLSCLNKMILFSNAATNEAV